jgi:RNA polymerase sigma-70 factor (ECF subfamily)
MGLDRGQFQELFATERERVFRFLWRLAGSAADADDLAQETFLATWRHRDQFEGRGSAAGWVLRTAYRLWLNSRRRRARRASLAGDVEPLSGAAEPAAPSSVAGPGAETVDARAFLVRRVEGALAALPEEARVAFVLFRFEGMTVPEIAEVVAAPSNTVASRIRRATRTLADDLAGLRHHLPSAR